MFNLLSISQSTVGSNFRSMVNKYQVETLDEGHQHDFNINTNDSSYFYGHLLDSNENGRGNQQNRNASKFIATIFVNI